ncbi:hypothetical protein [Hoyosella rhizosphaerae]|nr:hypothetical protein [Hoyosella rhizosphaerae]
MRIATKPSDSVSKIALRGLGVGAYGYFTRTTGPTEAAEDSAEI